MKKTIKKICKKFLSAKKPEKNIYLKNDNIQHINKINIIIKVDVAGSLDVILKYIKQLGEKNNIYINIINSSVGNLSLSDINIAQISRSLIIIFNIKVNNLIKKILKEKKIRTFFFDHIYNLKVFVKKEGLKLTSKKKIGIAKVIHTFLVKKDNTKIAGLQVTKGCFKKGSLVTIIRNKNKVFQDKIISIKKFKKEIAEIGQGNECGIKLKKFNNIKIGDIIKII